MGDMRELKVNPSDIKLKRADANILENVAKQINAERSDYAAGTLFGIQLTQKLLGLEELDQGEDQEEIAVTLHDLGVINTVVLQIGGISAYSSGTKFGILLALKILGKEDR